MEFIDNPSSLDAPTDPFSQPSGPKDPPPTPPSKKAARPQFRPVVYRVPKEKKGKGEGFSLGKAIAEGIKAASSKPMPVGKKKSGATPAKKKVDAREFRIKNPVSEFAIKSGKVKLTDKDVKISLKKK